MLCPVAIAEFDNQIRPYSLPDIPLITSRYVKFMHTTNWLSSLVFSGYIIHQLEV